MSYSVEPKVIIISPKSAYVNRMDLNHRDLMYIISTDSRFTIIEESEIENYDFSKYDILINDTWPNIKRKKMNMLNNIHSKKIIIGKFFQDYYQIQNKNDKVTSDEYDFIIFRYKTPITMGTDFFHLKDSYKYYLQHHFDTTIYKNYGLEKKYDIIIYGCMYEPLYPFRVRLKNLLLKNQEKYRIKYIKHPDYEIKNSREIIRRESLSCLINESWMSLSVPMNHEKNQDDFLQKFGETSLSYSLVLGYIPEEAKDYYSENYCRVTPDMSDSEIISTIDLELSNKEKMKEKIEIVYQNFINNLDFKKYPNKLYDICRSIYNNSNKKYTFIHPTKCGGTACEQFFHEHYHNYFLCKSHEYKCRNDNNSIIVIRDVYSRFFSMFNYFKSGSIDTEWKRENPLKNFTILEFIEIVRNHNIESHKSNYFDNQHVLSMSNWINSTQYENIIIIKYCDNLDEKIQKLLNILEIPNENIHMTIINKSIVLEEDVIMYEENKEYIEKFVNEHYADDVKLIEDIEKTPERFHLIL